MRLGVQGTKEKKRKQSLFETVKDLFNFPGARDKTDVTVVRLAVERILILHLKANQSN